MDKAKVSESLLRVVADRNRAIAIAGDLLETYSHTGSLSFWFALTRVLLALAWRPTAAFTAAILAGFSVSVVLLLAVSRHLWSGQVHEPTLVFHAMRYADISMPLCVLTVFSCVRFGLRDHLWRISAAYANVTAAFVYSVWVPHVQIVLYVALAVTIVLSLSTDASRRASGVIAAALVTGLLTKFAVERTTHTVVLHHWGPQWLLAWYLFFALYFFVPAAEVITCSLLRQRAFSEDPSSYNQMR